jgi:hypothetical protein
MLLADIDENSLALVDAADAAADVMALGHVAVDASSALENPGLLETLDSVREEGLRDAALERGALGTGAAASTGVSVGYVLWLLRGEFLLSGLLSSLPAWRMVDPLPVLAQLGDADADDGESLEQLVGGERFDPASPAPGLEDAFGTLGEQT